MNRLFVQFEPRKKIQRKFLSFEKDLKISESEFHNLLNENDRRRLINDYIKVTPELNNFEIVTYHVQSALPSYKELEKIAADELEQRELTKKIFKEIDFNGWEDINIPHPLRKSIVELIKRYLIAEKNDEKLG